MITIRLFRIGKKKQPAYKIIVTDKKNPPKGGRFIDEVGFYNPITKNRSIDGEKVKHWMSKGASVSNTVYNLLVQEGVVDGKKRGKSSLSEKEKATPTKEILTKSDINSGTAEEVVSKEVSDVEEK